MLRAGAPWADRVSTLHGAPVPFPETCRSQPELRASKPIGNCIHAFEVTHGNLSEYSFMVVVWSRGRIRPRAGRVRCKGPR